MNEEKKFAEFRLEEVEGRKVFVATDETIDREGDIISIEGWQTDNFKRNPVMLWSHNPYDLNIGKWKNLRFRTVNGKKKMTIEPDFHGITELSKSISEMVERGYMSTVSVGFRPYEKEGNTYTKQELLEVSFVNIPANPEATQLALSKNYSEETQKTLFGKVVEETKQTEVEINTDIPATQKQLEDLKAGFSAALTKEINRLEVAIKANPAESQRPSVGKGRIKNGKSDYRKEIKRLLQLGNKALSRALELEKKHG